MSQTKEVFTSDMIIELDNLRQKATSGKDKWEKIKQKVLQWKEANSAVDFFDDINNIVFVGLGEAFMNLNELKEAESLILNGIRIKSIDSIIFGSKFIFRKENSIDHAYDTLQNLETLDLKKLEANYFYRLNCTPYRRQAFYEGFLEKAIYEENFEKYELALESYENLLILISMSDIEMFEKIEEDAFFRTEKDKILEFCLGRFANLSDFHSKYGPAFDMLRFYAFELTIPIPAKLGFLILVKLLQLAHKAMNNIKGEIGTLNSKCHAYYSAHFLPENRKRNSRSKQLQQFMAQQNLNPNNPTTYSLKNESIAILKLLDQLIYENYHSKLQKLSEPVEEGLPSFNYILFNRVVARNSRIKIERKQISETFCSFLMKLGDSLQEQKDIIIRHLRHRPNNAHFMFYAITIYNKLGKYRKAKILVDEYLSIDREDRNKNKIKVFLTGSKICLNHFNLFQEALQYGLMAISEKERLGENAKVNFSNIYYVLGMCYSKYGDSQNYFSERKELKLKAVENFIRSNTFSQNNLMNLFSLARELAELNRPEEALEYLKKTHQNIEKTHPYTILIYIMVLSMLNESFEAYSICEPIFKMLRSKKDPLFIQFGVVKAELELFQALQMQSFVQKYQKRCNFENKFAKKAFKDLEYSHIINFKQKIAKKSQNAKKNEEASESKEESKSEEQKHSVSSPFSEKYERDDDEPIHFEQSLAVELNDDDNILYKSLRTYHGLIDYIQEEGNTVFRQISEEVKKTGIEKAYKNQQIVDIQNPKSPELLITYLNVSILYLKACIKLNKIQKAHCIYQSLEEFEQCHQDIQFCKALLLEAESKFEEAVQILDNILLDNPYHIDAAISFSSILLHKLNQTEKAYSALSHAVKVEFNNSKIHSLFGDIYTKTNNPKKAAQSYLKAIQLAKFTSIIDFRMIPKYIS